MDSSGASAGHPDPDLEAAGFMAERDRVCEEFAAAEGARQGGQLTGAEYLVVITLLVIAFALTLVLQ